MIKVSVDELSRIPRILTVTAVFAVIMNSFVVYTTTNIDQGGFHSKTLFRLFHLDRENNFPSWFSSVMLLLSSALLYSCYKLHRSEKGAKYWLFFSIIFLLLSIDEASSVHEVFIFPLRTVLDLSGVFYFAWIIIAIPVTLCIGLISIPFLRSIPRKTATRFFVAGVVYVIGAIGMEMIGGKMMSSAGTPILSYFIIVSIEETLEMTGIIYFIYGLTEYLAHLKSEGIGSAHQK